MPTGSPQGNLSQLALSPLKTLRAGLEPATCGLEDRCSIQLSYRSQGWALYAREGIMPTLVHCKRCATGPVAQRLELTTHNRSVPGSNPGRPIQHEYFYSTFRFFPHWHFTFACMRCRDDVNLYVFSRQSSHRGERKICKGISLGNARSNPIATAWASTHY